MIGGLEPQRTSIVHALLANAELGADAPATVFVPERAVDGAGDVSWRHDELAAAAARVAAGLAAEGVGPGDRVMLCLPTSPEFVTAFFGALLLGAVPTAVATPGGFGSADIFLDKFTRLLGYLEPAAVVASVAVLNAAPMPDSVAAIDGAVLHALACAPDAPTLPPRLPAPGDLAFIQATSGSTGTPKGCRSRTATWLPIASRSPRLRQWAAATPGWAGCRCITTWDSSAAS